MSWFEEQIEQRKRQDNELFVESLENIASAVTGQRRTADRMTLSRDAIDTILKYYGCQFKGELPGKSKAFQDQLTDLCRPFGLMFRSIKLTENWWKDCVGAVLAFRREDSSAVALLPDGFGYHFLNAEGKKERVSRKNAEQLTVEGYCFYKPFPNRRLTALDLTKYALSTRSIKDIIILLAIMGAATLIGLLIPKLSYFLYSTVVESGSMQLLFSTIGFFLCVSFSQTLFTQFQTMYNNAISTKTDVAVKAAAMMRILSLPPSFFRKFSAGELSNRSDYLTSLSQILLKLLFGTGLTSLFSLAYITSILRYAPGLAVPAMIVILVTITFSLIATLTRQKLSKQTMELGSKESGMTYATISGIKKIRIAGAEKRAFARWAQLYAKKAETVYRPPVFVKLSGVITLAISTAGTIVMYFFAIRTGVTLAQYNAFTTAYGMVFGAFSALLTMAASLSQIKPVLEMAKPIMDCVPEISEKKEIVTKLNGKIEFSNVSFTYSENMPLVVDNMTFTIKPNQYIGIVGKTGCGKSTLIRLLLGFEKAQKGTVYYDGKDINALDLKSLRRKIGVVMQDSKLFQGDIFSNITISAPWLSLDDAWEAAEAADIADDISAMPMGMNTLITEGSGGVSGGQRQRLVIARAIAPKPKILIFDEATSALDNITQKKVSEALDRLKCTRIVIAHRLSTIKNCDRILYLGDGKILEDGTYEELIAKNGLFAELVERQRVDT